ncbi:hypothetical protein [Pyruvatibacter sp.]|uniref:hypothetical protein n=1 Tax=Pyruvatibacter sp. TaxID=1981328 RepID=UPI003266C99E
MASPYCPMPETRTCAEAWLAAAEHLLEVGPTNTMILHIQEPQSYSATDDLIIAEVDAFLRKHGVYPVTTVANTIFPQALYRPGDPARLYARYKALFKRVKKLAPDWGRYFDRMIRWNSSDGTQLNQLCQLVTNLKKYGPLSEEKSTYYNIYELTLFHPEKDARKALNRQCLSFIEVKPEVDNQGRGVLHMTALYRSHYYVARTLGNLIGLSRLLDFIAAESGYTPGSLTIHSTHAELDTRGAEQSKGRKAWGKADVKELVSTCRAFTREPAPATP